MSKKDLNRPFCMAVISLIFSCIGFGTSIGMLIMHIINNHFVLFGQINTSWITAWNDVIPYCTLTPPSLNLNSFACTKFYYHIQYLMIQNLLLILALVLILFIISFSIVLLVNIKKKQQKCISQLKLKKVILGLYSFLLVFAFTQTTYFLSLYLDMSGLMDYSNNVSDYRNTFFVGVITTMVGSIMLFAAFIILFTVKTAKSPSNKSQKNAENGQNSALNNTKQTNKDQQSRLLKDKNKKSKNMQEQMMPIKKQKKVVKPRQSINIDQVQNQQQQYQDEQNKSAMYGGIYRPRPSLPTVQQNKNAYPKRQKPRFIKPIKKIAAQALNLLNQAKYDSINKPTQAQIQMNVNLISQQQKNEQKQQNSFQNEQQNDNSQASVKILNKKKQKMQVQMVSMTKNTQGHSAVDPTHLHIFKRSMNVANLQKLKSRWNKQ